VHFDAVFNGQKTRTVSHTALHGARILRFSRETKLAKECKNYPKIHGQTKEVAQSPPPPEYATVYMPIEVAAFL